MSASTSFTPPAPCVADATEPSTSSTLEQQQKQQQAEPEQQQADANAPTILTPPPLKIRAPAPPLVAPPAHLLMRAKSDNPKPKWRQQPTAPYTSLRPFLTHAAPLDAPPPHRLPPSGPPSSLRPPLIRIQTPWAQSIAAALAHSGLPPQVAADSPVPVEGTDVSSPEKWDEFGEHAWKINT
jgi:hypothetical protein